MQITRTLNLGVYGNSGKLESAADAWLVNMRTDDNGTNEWTALAFTHQDFKELSKRLNSALRQGKKRMEDR